MPAKKSAEKKTKVVKTEKATKATKTTKVKKEVVAPKPPSDAVIRRLAKIAAPMADAKVSKDILSHVRAIYVSHYNKMAKEAMKRFKEINAALEAKDKAPSKALNIKSLSVLGYDKDDKAMIKDLVHCPSKYVSAADVYDNRDSCLLISKPTFKKYLTVGSDDGKFKAVFEAKLAPKVGKRGDGFTFGSDFLEGLQHAVQTATVLDIEAAWKALGKKKTLSHQAFVDAGKAMGEAPAEKPKRKAPAKKAAGQKKATGEKKSGEKKKAPVKKTKKAGKGKKKSE
jgi:hypothetical protein